MQVFEFLWFLKENFLTWGNLMPEYQHTFIRIFKSPWLRVHLQGRKKISQRFYLAYLNYCPTTRGHWKLACLKKKKRLQHSFHTPTRPWGSSTSFLWLFLEASVFFSRPATKDVLCCYRGLCVWLTLELFLESVITICIDLVEPCLEQESHVAIFVFVCGFATLSLQMNFSLRVFQSS